MACGNRSCLPLCSRRCGHSFGRPWAHRRDRKRGELLDTVVGKKLRIRFDAVHGTAEATDEQGKPWPSTMAYWFAWFAFHPKTEVLHVP